VHQIQQLDGKDKCNAISNQRALQKFVVVEKLAFYVLQNGQNTKTVRLGHVMSFCNK